VTARSERRRRDLVAPRVIRRRAGASDATIEPDPGPPPEAVFDRVTGPHARRAAVAMPGAGTEDP